MNKKTTKIIVCAVVAVILLISIVSAGGIRKTIQVTINSVSLMVNGKRVAADTILYNGATYVPLRAAAEMLGKEVGWDQETNTASINDKSIEGAITIDQIAYQIDIQEPDTLGNVYAKATYTNNTKYPITSITLTALLRDKNEKTYFSDFDTVMPGETSPIFEAFGPSTQKLEDIQLLKVTIIAQNTNGKTLRVDYDAKLNKYEYMEY